MYQNNQSQYIYIEVNLWLHGYISYSREISTSFYDRIGKIVVDKEVLESIESIEDLLKAFRKRSLCTYVEYNYLDIDDAMEFLLQVYGKDFVPDENEDWYLLRDGNGLSGEKVVNYLNAYKEDLEERNCFIDWLEKYKSAQIEEITIELQTDDKNEKVVWAKNFL